DLVMLTGITAISLALSAALASATMTIIRPRSYISTKLRRNIRGSRQYPRIQQARTTSHLNESMQGIRITQSFTQEKENTEYFDGVNKANFESFRDAVKKSAMFRPFVEISNAVGTIILVSYGAFLILQGDIEIGTFVSFA